MQIHFTFDRSDAIESFRSRRLNSNVRPFLLVPNDLPFPSFKRRLSCPNEPSVKRSNHRRSILVWTIRSERSNRIVSTVTFRSDRPSTRLPWRGPFRQLRQGIAPTKPASAIFKRNGAARSVHAPAVRRRPTRRSVASRTPSLSRSRRRPLAPRAWRLRSERPPAARCDFEVDAPLRPDPSASRPSDVARRVEASLLRRLRRFAPSGVRRRRSVDAGSAASKREAAGGSLRFQNRSRRRGPIRPRPSDRRPAVHRVVHLLRRRRPCVARRSSAAQRRQCRGSVVAGELRRPRRLERNRSTARRPAAAPTSES